MRSVAGRSASIGRTVATVFNAYIGPLMKRYVTEIASRAREPGTTSPDVLFAQCVGGCVPSAEAAAAPLYTVDSGPVSGVLASSVLGPKMGYPNIITTDMGGTTFDVGIVYQGAPLTRNETMLDQFEMSLPMIDVVSIGAGGGSIALYRSGQPHDEGGAAQRGRRAGTDLLRQRRHRTHRDRRQRGAGNHQSRLLPGRRAAAGRRGGAATESRGWRPSWG